MLRGAHDLAVESEQNIEDGQKRNGHVHQFQHQHSAPASSSFRGRQSQNGSFNSKESYQADGEDTPRTSASDQQQQQRIRRGSQQDPSPRVPGISALHEVAALRKHMKILEERLRNERHTHAIKFSEIEKQLIQENAKLKVSTSALQRQIRREQQLISDHEAELSKLKKEKKNRFSLSGITRSFSDVRLEDVEMKESSLKRKNTDIEVVRILKERLDDSERDRAEAEALFNQRISGLLRERNIQRADMRIAEESVTKLTSQNEALQKDMDDLRFQISDIMEKSYQGDSVQMSLLKRANSQLQEELNHFHREREKLVTELETISEELTLAKANERQNQVQSVATGEMKNKIDSLRVKLSSLERGKIQDVDFHAQEDSASDVSARSVVFNGPSTSAAQQPVPATYPQKVAELETELRQKKRELIESHRKLVNILELSQRYEFHCYNLEKELSKVYGNKYRYVETDWRKKDTVFLKDLRQTVKRTVESQTDTMVALPSNRTATVATVHVPSSSSKRTSFSAISTQTDPLIEVTKLAESRQEIQTLQRALRTLEEKYNLLEQQLHDLSEDDGVYDEPITQAEIDAKIMEVRARVAAMESLPGGGAAVHAQQPVLAASNPFALLDGVEDVNYLPAAAPSSGIWTSWSSGSSTGTTHPRRASEY